jgi:hypothetical protein
MASQSLDGRLIATLSDAREVMLTVAPHARSAAAWRYVGKLLKEAAAGRAPMTEVEEMLYIADTDAGVQGMRAQGCLQRRPPASEAWRRQAAGPAPVSFKRLSEASIDRRHQSMPSAV